MVKRLGKVTKYGIFQLFIITVSNFVNINDICKLGHPLVVVVVVVVVVVFVFLGGGAS